MRFLLAVVICTVVVGCAGVPAPSPTFTPGATGSPTGAPPSATASPTGGLPGPTPSGHAGPRPAPASIADPCGLLSAAEISAALGTDVGEGDLIETPGLRGVCQWMGSEDADRDGLPDASLTLYAEWECLMSYDGVASSPVGECGLPDGARRPAQDPDAIREQMVNEGWIELDGLGDMALWESDEMLYGINSGLRVLAYRGDLELRLEVIVYNPDRYDLVALEPIQALMEQAIGRL